MLKTEAAIPANVLDHLTSILVAEARSKIILHAKMAIESIGLSADHKELIKNNHEVGNHHSEGLITEGKKQCVLLWACCCKFRFSDDKFISACNFHHVESFDNGYRTRDRTSNCLER